MLLVKTEQETTKMFSSEFLIFYEKLFYFLKVSTNKGKIQGIYLLGPCVFFQGYDMNITLIFFISN